MQTRRARRLWTMLVILAVVSSGCGPGRGPGPTPIPVTPQPGPTPIPRDPQAVPDELVIVTAFGDLQVLSTESGEVLRTLSPGGLTEYPAGVAISPDRSWVYFVVLVGGDDAQDPDFEVGIARVDYEGGEPQLLLPGFSPALHHDGRRFAYVGLGPDGAANEIVERDLRTGRERRWFLDERPGDTMRPFIHSVSWGPGDELVYVIAREQAGDPRLLDTTHDGASLWDGPRLVADPDESSWNWAQFRGAQNTLGAVQGCCPPAFEQGWRLVAADPDAPDEHTILLELDGVAGPIDFDLTGEHLLYVREGVLWRWSGGEPVHLADGVVAAAWL